MLRRGLSNDKSVRSESAGVDRRSLLLAAGGTALASGARAETGGGGGPPPSKAAYMTVWAAAEKVELWPDGAPGAEAFRRRRGAAGRADPAHMVNIERPALHVFRSPRPSGQGLLVMPGGATASSRWTARAWTWPTASTPRA